MARVHPDLKRLLGAGRSASAHAQEPGGPLEVVVQLKPSKGGKLDSPEATHQTAESLLARVATMTGDAPLAVNVFANLRSLVVRAKPSFLRKLLDQPEVRSAVANQRS